MDDIITDSDPGLAHDALEGLLGPERPVDWPILGTTNLPLLTEAPLADLGQPVYSLPGPASTELFQGDCRGLLAKLPSESVDLVVSDPPYNIGINYGTHYYDQQPSEQFLEMLETVMREVHRVLTSTGSLFLFMGANLQAEVLLLLKKLGFHYRTTIVWHYTFGVAQQGNFTPSYVPIHYMTKNSRQFTFNAAAVRVPSARSLKYSDKRASPKGKLPNNVWILDPAEEAKAFQPDADAWLFSRVCGTFKERTGHVTQLPLALIERIVTVASNPGDLVLDPFAGTGTTLVAARRLGRRSVGVELSEQTALIAKQRLSDQLALETSPATTPVTGQP